MTITLENNSRAGKAKYVFSFAIQIKTITLIFKYNVMRIVALVNSHPFYKQRGDYFVFANLACFL